MKRFLSALILLSLRGCGPIAAQEPIFIGPGTKVAHSPKSHKQPAKLLEIGETAPDWKLTDVNGTSTPSLNIAARWSMFGGDATYKKTA